MYFSFQPSFFYIPYTRPFTLHFLFMTDSWYDYLIHFRTWDILSRHFTGASECFFLNAINVIPYLWLYYQGLLATKRQTYLVTIFVRATFPYPHLRLNKIFWKKRLGARKTCLSPPSIFIFILTVPRRYFCCGSLLFLLSVLILWFIYCVSDIFCKF